MNDNYLSDGNYIFIMYDSWGERLLSQGEIYLISSYDTTLTGNYWVQYSSEPFLNNQGPVSGTINKKEGKAIFSFSENPFDNIKVKIDNNINLASGEWNYGAQRGRFVLFKIDNLK